MANSPQIPIPLWGDGSLYGDGDRYTSTEGIPFEYKVEKEVQCHRLSVKLSYTASSIAGAPEAFRIHDIRVRLAPIRQSEYTHQAYVDKVTPSERLAVAVTHSGSEFIISHIQLRASRKRHQPKG